MEPKLFRESVGTVLRALRTGQGRTLGEVASAGHLSLGYLSEVERGYKEASSEMLSAISAALNVPLWHILRLVARDIAQYGVGAPEVATRRAA
ncbi:MAG: helix-turn-helix domain-containing protein [Propionibacteriaceae bacterium]|jgi:transcriptional regulator with XRE-family HTH domain|nr:helix-turn-helix domain-containing protein [Propionibacteriaceae bacterium]